MSFSIEKTKNSYTLSVISENGSKMYLHSRINPEKEKSIDIEKIKTNKTIVFLGLGLGFHIENIIHEISFSKIIVFEKEKNLLKEILKLNICKQLLGHKNIVFFESLNNNEITRAVKTSIEVEKDLPVFIVSHPASMRAFPAYYSGIQKEIDSFVSKKISDKITSSRFGHLFLKNAFINFSSDKIYNLNSLIGSFSNYESIVVSSGPSLDVFLPKLKILQNFIFIIAADSAVNSLLKFDIVPDFIISIDPQAYTWEHLLNEKSSPVYLHSLTAHVPIKTEKQFFYINTHPFCQILESIDRNIPCFDAKTGNVTGDALLFSKSLGFRKTYILGLDSSFPFLSIYSRGSGYHYRFINSTNRFKTIETMSFDYIFNKSSNFKFNGIHSRKSFINYKMQIENLIDETFIHINTKGIPLEGILTSNEIVCENTEINKLTIIEKLLSACKKISFDKKRISYFFENEAFLKDFLSESFLSASLSDKKIQKTISFIRKYL